MKKISKPLNDLAKTLNTRERKHLDSYIESLNKKQKAMNSVNKIDRDYQAIYEKCSGVIIRKLVGRNKLQTNDKIVAINRRFEKNCLQSDVLGTEMIKTVNSWDRDLKFAAKFIEHSISKGKKKNFIKVITHIANTTLKQYNDVMLYKAELKKLFANLKEIEKEVAVYIN